MSTKIKKPKKIGVFKVYFTTSGDLMYSLRYYDEKNGNFKEEDNHVFTDQLEYTGYSGSHILFKSLMSGRKYHMFISDFHEMMVAKQMHENVIEGQFTFVKKGRVQGFRMILPPKP